MIVAQSGGGGGSSHSAAPVELGHLATPARLADALRTLCGADVGEATLRSTELRLAGNDAARSGDLPRAVELYTQVGPLLPACLWCRAGRPAVAAWHLACQLET
jgi:hypothetical protein